MAGEGRLRVKLLGPGARAPARGSAGAAGYDLSASESAVVRAGGRALVKTGLSIAIPSGTYARCGQHLPRPRLPTPGFPPPPPPPPPSTSFPSVLVFYPQPAGSGRGRGPDLPPPPPPPPPLPPTGTPGPRRVAPRSGLAYKKGIDVGAGVIDEDYRGEVGVILFNFGEEDFEVAPGDRIAQLILERIATPDVEVVADLDATDRGAGGFGSTGVQAQG